MSARSPGHPTGDDAADPTHHDPPGARTEWTPPTLPPDGRTRNIFDPGTGPEGGPRRREFRKTGIPNWTVHKLVTCRFGPQLGARHGG
ncbi:hypothetical protein GCM10023094_35260 [Rhodococcus olei]|uniref:Uncharacterized protein n=1 Tax=Rhodococcus olei TaxID=2161675 RepID=A0ABP8P825_9NOCA